MWISGFMVTCSFLCEKNTYGVFLSPLAKKFGYEECWLENVVICS